MKLREIAVLIAFMTMIACALPAQQSGVPAAVKDQEPVTIDTSAIAKETEQIVQRNHKMGIFWWAPAEFFEASAMNSGAPAERAREVFAPLRDYTLVIVACGEIQIGGIHWMKEDEVRKAVVLRDQKGNIYKPLEDVSSEVGDFAEMMKPVLAGLIGPMGEGMHLIFFPKKDSSGREIANPFKRTEFSLLTTGLMEPGTTTYTWKLPVNALAPPRFCPIGKERVDARWTYCPWHGNKLEDEPEPITPLAPPPKPKK